MQTYHVILTAHGSIDCFTIQANDASAAVKLALDYHDAHSDFAIHAIICGGTECPLSLYNHGS